MYKIKFILIIKIINISVPIGYKVLIGLSSILHDVLY